MYEQGNDVRLWPVAAMRIYTGIFFLYYGIKKLLGGSFDVTGFLESRLESTFAFYQPIIENVVLPNAKLFSFLVAWGELALGIALILGLATRYAAFAGAFMLANFWFAKGQGFLEGQNHDSLWMMVLLMLALVPAGKILGLDQRLSGRYTFLR